MMGKPEKTKIKELMTSVVWVADVRLLLPHHTLFPLRQRADEATIRTDVWLTGLYIRIGVLVGGSIQTVNHVTSKNLMCLHSHIGQSDPPG